MANEFLNSLLREYDQKKIKAELELESRKQNLYNLFPRLKEIDDELNHFAFNTTKNILNRSNSNDIDKYVIDFKDKIDILKKEKEKILLKNNYPVDYLKPSYECKLCNDTGYISDSNYHTTMCSCLKQKLLDISFNKSNMYNIKNENFDYFNEHLFSDQVNSSDSNSNISPRENIKIIKNKCEQFIQNFENSNCKNLLFTGSTGLR